MKHCLLFTKKYYQINFFHLTSSHIRHCRSIFYLSIVIRMGNMTSQSFVRHQWCSSFLKSLLGPWYSRMNFQKAQKSQLLPNTGTYWIQNRKGTFVSTVEMGLTMQTTRWKILRSTNIKTLADMSTKLLQLELGHHSKLCPKDPKDEKDVANYRKKLDHVCLKDLKWCFLLSRIIQGSKGREI